MPVKDFKFVSPGVFINEIDNSFRPREPDAIGATVIGRSVRGLGMQPGKVPSFSEYVTNYGDTVPGNGGGDIARFGNRQSPMYGTYAAKAYLDAQVAPLTYVRLLGHEHPTEASGVRAGWSTPSGSTGGSTASPSATLGANGGAFGVFLFPSASLTAATATIQISSSTVTDGRGITIVSTDGTSQDYVATGSGENLANSQFVRVGGEAAIAASLKACIEDSNGHGGKITVTLSTTATTNDTLNLTQATPGALGNRATVHGAGGGFGSANIVTSSGGFTGGSSAYATAGQLAAIVYAEAGTIVQLSGSDVGGTAGQKGSHIMVTSDSNKELTIRISSSATGVEESSFNFDYQSENFIRNRLNTNPQLLSKNGDYYPSTSEKCYWLGETFEQSVRDNSLVNADVFATILPIALNGTVTTGPHNMKPQSAREAVAGWFIPQDLGAHGSFNAANLPKLFRLRGRGHGEWLNKNVKVSIERIKQSTTLTSDYGTFSVVLRSLGDNDSNVQVLERFDNLSLNPNSENFISKIIGNKYYEWSESDRTLKEYGEYDNASRYVYVETNSDMDDGALDPKYLPFGFYMPPSIKSVSSVSASAGLSSTLLLGSASVPTEMVGNHGGVGVISSSVVGALTCSFEFPSVALRVSASDGGLSDPTEAYFGMRTTTEASTTINDPSVIDMHRLMQASFPDDPTTSATTGFDAYSSIFTLNDVKVSSGNYFYSSGSRKALASPLSASQLLDAGYDSFTAPFWGGFDGFDITKPDPLANSLMSTAGTTDKNNYVYYTYKRAIDTVADAEFIDTNLITVPGLTKTGLTEHLVKVAEARADALALIDLPDVYIPPHEVRKNSRSERIGSTPRSSANSLKNRQIDSSYGATFYPWVQTRDSATGQNVWVPPTVAVLGVLASSERASEVWFAPAGFNRGGLTDGAAGIPIVGVSERLRAKDRDLLYEARINPIASFPSTGIVLFGQKTLQERPSALDRINVRRLVIFLKKQISILSTQILFEQNVQATWNRFKGLVEPLLANTKIRFGIEDYRLFLDETTTTPDFVDQNVLYAKIMVKPAKAIEFIAIDFVIASSGASFDD